MGKTTIEITDDVWELLNQRKSKGESFNDVVVDLLEAQGTEVKA